MPAPRRSGQSQTNTRLGRAIARARWRMRAVAGAEQLLYRAAPLAGILALFFILSWFGIFRAVPDWARIAMLAILGFGALLSIWPLTRIARTDPRGIDRRIEQKNRITHQAIGAQDDRLGNDDPFARALWAEHQRRLASQIDALSTGTPRSQLPDRDPFGLRVAIGLLLVTAFGYSFSGTSGRVSDAFTRHDDITAADIRVDAWISPPGYISAAPVFLTGQVNRGDAPVHAVEGSEITVRVGSAPDKATITYAGADGARTPIEPTAPGTATGDTTSPAHSTVFTYKPRADGTLSVETSSGRMDFPITITPDEPPVLSFIDEPRRAANGALELAYSITDDHGVVGARAEIVPLEAQGPNAVPLYDPPEYKLTLPRRGARDGEATASQDLTEHPLAGQKVAITLIGTDGAGQEGRSETIETVLPARRFNEPLAAAIIEHRGLLALDAHNLPRIFDLQDALTLAPEETIPNLTHFLLFQSVRGRLDNARSETDLREAIDYMWGVALQIEDGNLSLAARKLRDAQQALADALENGASDEEIARLMDELREAMQDYLSELARQAPNQQAQQNQMSQNMLRQRDLDNMLDQIENLARSGARDQAQELLSQLQQMMNNLQAGRQQQQQQQQGGPMREQMDKLGELMRQQQQLMNETFNLDQQQQGRPGRPPQDGQQQQGQQQQGQNQQGQNQDGEQQPGQGDQPSMEELLQQLQEQQQALRDQLEQMQKELEGLGMQPSEGFGEAGEAMGDAEGNLGGGQTGDALGDQGRALQALREGAQDMMNQMMQAMGQQQPGSGQQPGPYGQGNSGPDDRDPLGRPRASNGPDFGNRVKVPDEIDIQRAREILDAIRKRLGDRLSPEIEKQYLERLLDLQ
ncbi:TIGR02302 family protein [Pseudohoeflea suaedae]|uniref:TIGR02302 family protein n=1 Tax=Pseudohoeflea suaedae TaxID=877384 RepID=A0A4R5PJ10_9HYPH|nr:TIGR02302 family protein [Pseudohoeflea suaedae]TDH34830.1 TIGR02302 family protein [Pseudohoeflea suaedae]